MQTDEIEDSVTPVEAKDGKENRYRRIIEAHGMGKEWEELYPYSPA